MEFTNEGGCYHLNFTTNVDWSIVILSAEEGWCNINKKEGTAGIYSLIVTAAQSEEYEDRTATIVLKAENLERSVQVHQSGSAILDLTQTEFNVGSQGGTVSVPLSSNFKTEVIMPDVDWITQSEGSRALDDYTLVFNISPNTSFENRSAIIDLKDSNYGYSESITINQTQYDTLMLSNDLIEVAPEGSVISVDITSNTNYTIEIPTSCSEWISRTSAQNLDTTRSLSDNTAWFKIATSMEYEAREGEIFFRYSDREVSLKIHQAGSTILIPSRTTYTCSGNAGTTLEIAVTSNVTYNLSISEDWIHEITSSSNSSKMFALAENCTGQTRTAEITFTSVDGVKSAVVTVSQMKRQNPIHLQSSAEIPEGSTYQFSANCNEKVTWESSDPSILEIDENGKATALKLGSVTITATTEYGDHSSSCSVSVFNITDFISAYDSGVSTSSININGLIQNSYSIHWTFKNSSSVNVTLVSLQLKYGSTNQTSNEMPVNVTVNAGEKVEYKTTIDPAWIHTSVTCIFKYTYNGQTYTTTATH
jgi:hypothetical protein